MKQWPLDISNHVNSFFFLSWAPILGKTVILCTWSGLPMIHLCWGFFLLSHPLSRCFLLHIDSKSVGGEVYSVLYGDVIEVHVGAFISILTPKISLLYSIVTQGIMNKNFMYLMHAISDWSFVYWNQIIIYPHICKCHIIYNFILLLT